MIYIIEQVYATTFRPQSVAYVPNDHYLRNPRDVLVSLPVRYPNDKRAIVIPYYHGRSVLAHIWDRGPWHLNDWYWKRDGGVRPWAEVKHALFDQGRTDDEARGDSRDVDGIPRLVVNPAGVDFSPETWVQLGISEKRAYGYKFSDWLDALAIIEFDGEPGPTLVPSIM